MGWIRFKASSKDIEPRLTVRSNGHLGVSDSAVTAYGLDKFKYVVMYINQDEKKIGFKFTNNANEEGKKPFRTHPKAGATIPARGFLKTYGLLDSLNKKRMPCLFDDKENMLIAGYG